MSSPEIHWEWTSDKEHFAARAAQIKELTAKLLIEFFGDRCGECRRWKLLDELLENPFSDTGDETMSHPRFFGLPEPIGEHTEFVWGPVVEVHKIGRISIVEYHPQIFRNNSATGEYEKETTMFHHYVDGECGGTSCKSLELSLLTALAHQQNGAGANQAAFYAARVLGIE